MGRPPRRLEVRRHDEVREGGWMSAPALPPRPEPIRAGSYATVEVTGAAAHHLRGELREVVHVATHRTRIPVAAG